MPSAFSDPEVRNTAIGGSDAAAVTGRSKWCTPFGLYCEKTGVIPHEDIGDKPEVHWGKIHEDTIAAEWSRVTGKKIRRCNRTRRHPQHNWMMAHLDRVVVGEKAFLEVKTASQFVSHDWGESGTSLIPGYYLDQVDHYMMVTGWDRAYVAVLIAGSDFRHYLIDRDEGRLDALASAEVEFKRRWDESDPPPLSTEGDVDMAHPLSDPHDIATAEDHISLSVHRLHEIAAEMAVLKTRQEKHRVIVKRAMGDAESLVDPYGNVLATWKSQETRRFQTKLFKQRAPVTYARYIGTSLSRVLRLSSKGK